MGRGAALDRSNQSVADAMTYLLRSQRIRNFFERHGDYLRSEAYLFTAFGLYEGLVNLISAAGFLLYPSFMAKELAPRFREDKFMDHPVVKLLLRLFGATEILVAGLFIFVLNKNNAKKFLPVVLAGDLVHYAVYTSYTRNHFDLTFAVLAHYFTMSSGMSIVNTDFTTDKLS